MRAVLHYVRTSPVLLNTLVMMAIVGMFTYEFSVLLPLYSELTFDAAAVGYAAMTAAMGAGAVADGLSTAKCRTSTLGMVLITEVLFRPTVMLTALAPPQGLAVTALCVVGAISIAFASLANVTLELNSAPDMQKRVMVCW